MKKHFLIFAVTVCLITAFSLSLDGFHSIAQSDSMPPSYKYYKSIIVSKNDTLWSIAEDYMDMEHYGSVSDYISEVRRMNAMADDEIHYGEHLVIPYYDSEFME